MTDSERPTETNPAPSPTHRMPSDSTFFERIVPILLLAMGLFTVLLILFALGVLLGVVPFR